jgi:hypothetical protein
LIAWLAFVAEQTIGSTIAPSASGAATLVAGLTFIALKTRGDAWCNSLLELPDPQAKTLLILQVDLLPDVSHCDRYTKENMAYTGRKRGFKLAPAPIYVKKFLERRTLAYTSGSPREFV